MKNKKIFIVLILVFIAIMFFINTSNAFSVENLTGNTSNTNEITDSMNKSIKIIATIGSIVSVIVIIVLGIKYMIGSVEEKASYKKSLVPYIIGAALVFAASGIAQIVYEIAIQIKK